MFKTVITPRISETNAARHIGHTAVPVWLEAGFDGILRIFNPEMSLDPKLAMVNLSIDYLREMFYGRDAEVLTWVKKVGGSSFLLYQEVYQDGKLCARANTTFVHFNYSEKKPEPIPEEICLILRSHFPEE